MTLSRQEQFLKAAIAEGGNPVAAGGPRPSRGVAMKESCFVVMAIGDQTFNGISVTADSLRVTYDTVVKEALIQARPGLEVIRADEVSDTGTITTDILTRLMHSTFVVVDITYPNPNVFYELGIRHASKPGTLLIRDAASPNKAPFDVSHQRYLEYQQTPAGVKVLANGFRERFRWYDSHAGEPDNQLLSLAKLTGYNFPQFGNEAQEEAVDKFSELFTIMLSNPQLMTLLSDDSIPKEDKQRRILQVLADDPKQAKKMLKLFFALGVTGRI